MSLLPRVLHVSTADVLGGAERIAHNLHREYAARGLSSSMVVGRKMTDDPAVFVVPNAQAGGLWRRVWWGLHRRHQPRYRQSAFARRAVRLAHRMAEPMRILDERRGFEDFRYPGSYNVLEACSFEPSVLHCHNLHGKYFDLRALPALSRACQIFVTLHDAWMLTGHCAHSFECERWRAGCGDCPDLSIYPSVLRDGTARNWSVKKDIYQQCRLYVATPSQWLMDRVAASMLAPACVETCVIPNGVDASIYCPGQKDAARERLGLPQGARILLTTGYRPVANPWKDHATLREAVRRVRQEQGDNSLLCLSVGNAEEDVAAKDALIQRVPFVQDERTMADYYRAADIYVHAAKVDTFPNSVLEALACGTPVVATAVGGIPEQIVTGDASTNATGVLVDQGDAEAMAAAIWRLLASDDLRNNMSHNAAADAAARFTLKQQVDRYIAWYERVLSESCAHSAS